MPSENSITTTEPFRGARTRRPATARDPRPSFRSTTCTGVTLARFMVESTGQLRPAYLNGPLQVREMSADVGQRSISPKTQIGCDSEQGPGLPEVVECQRRKTLWYLPGFIGFEAHLHGCGPAVAA